MIRFQIKVKNLSHNQPNDPYESYLPNKAIGLTTNQSKFFF